MACPWVRGLQTHFLATLKAGPGSLLQNLRGPFNGGCSCAGGGSRTRENLYPRWCCFPSTSGSSSIHVVGDTANPVSTGLVLIQECDAR